MAVCKIIPIKQAKGIGACVEYITDDKKVVSVIKFDSGDSVVLPSPGQVTAIDEQERVGRLDFNTVLAYMENDAKTHRPDDVRKKFISGYMCNPEDAVQEFLNTKKINLSSQGRDLPDETGNWAYHIIQSFPEGLDISDEEVHQCGRELCERLGAYQAVICSHVHPVISEEGEVSGRCKHNHILINSHMLPEMIDPEHPDVYKYNNCRETYAQLQKWNDEISLAHGLPIIRNPDLDRRYSWFTSQEENEGISWTRQVARDIKKTMRFCSNWEEFKVQMTAQGYFIRDTGKTITYYTPEHTPEHKQQVREKRLGREYTRAALERYWTAMSKQSAPDQQQPTRTSKTGLIKTLIDLYGTDLFAVITTTSKNGTYTLDVPVKNPRRDVSDKVLKTYFEPDKTYDLCTSDHEPIAQVTGQDLFDYYEQLRKEREELLKKAAKKKAEEEEYYFDPAKTSSTTHQPYKIRLWDENGRRRTSLELICILAIVIIKNEHFPYSTHPIPSFSFQGADGRYITAKTDWKLQHMYDTMSLARDMHVADSQDIHRRLDRAGKEVARLRKQTRLLTEQFNQMQTIYENIEALEAVRAICEELYAMPDGPEKTAALAAHAAELEQYTAAKRYLHTKAISTDEDILDFLQRYTSTESHLAEVQADLDAFNEEYRGLKKIEHSITIAQSEYYCYGPNHPRYAEEAKRWERKEEKDAQEESAQLD